MGSKLGSCCPFGDPQNKRINNAMRAWESEDLEVIKLLFLGAGGSGKSTLFRQLRLLHGNGLQEEERLNFRKSIYQNIVFGMKTLVKENRASQEDDESGSDQAQQSKVSDKCDQKLAEYIETLDEGAPISEECAKLIKKAWKERGLQETWKGRAKMQLEDTLKYFLENIDRIAKRDYIPSKDDVLHVRIQTTGIVEERLTMESRPFLLVDVGGQRSERRKWINCFSDVVGLIFVASLTAYNQVLWEDEKVNRLEESLHLFKKVLKDDDTFDNACVVLFLNKSDLFTEMTKTTPIRSYLKSYEGGDTEEEQYEYIKNLYLKQVNRKVFTHKTCATNTDQIKVIFETVNHYVIKQALIKAGLLPPQ